MGLARGQGELRKWQQRPMRQVYGGTVGDPNREPSSVSTLLVQNVVVHRKWLVQPESAIARRSCWVVLAGTKKLEVRLCSSEKLDL